MKAPFYCLFVFTILMVSCSKDISAPNPTEPPIPGETNLTFPKKELRGVWIPTVWALDWPRTLDYSNVEYNTIAQKVSFTTMLDNLKSVGFNSVFVQIRGMGDAYYNSEFEPWSSSITGTRGKDPGYDVLKFMIDETHKRGLEFHAWINPYRIATRSSGSTNYPALHSSVNSSWVVDHEKIQIYNPALPEVRQRLANIIKEIILKYDVDGIHMDDYFYPDPSSAGTMISDSKDFQDFGAGYANIQDFRRGNVDKAIELIFNTIRDVKPSVVFSISPAANKEYNYNTLYADISKWCQRGWLDILIPQLYQEIGNNYNDFQLNLGIWSQHAYNTKLVIGHGLYKFGVSSSPAAFQSTLELERQFTMSKTFEKVEGSVMYRASDIYFNRINITETLKELYKNKVVMPFAGRQVANPTDKPSNVKLTGNKLSWDPLQGNNTRYVVYYFSDMKKVGEVLSITNSTDINISSSGYYCVTSLNEDHLESSPSNTVQKN